MAIRPKSYKYATSVLWTGEKKGALTVAGEPPLAGGAPPREVGRGGGGGRGGVWFWGVPFRPAPTKGQEPGGVRGGGEREGGRGGGGGKPAGRGGDAPR